MYGLNLPARIPFVLGCIGGAFGGAVVALSQTVSFSFGIASIFTFTQVIPSTGFDATVWGLIAGSLVSVLFSVSSTYLYGLRKYRLNKVANEKNLKQTDA